MKAGMHRSTLCCNPFVSTSGPIGQLESIKALHKYLQIHKLKEVGPQVYDVTRQFDKRFFFFFCFVFCSNDILCSQGRPSFLFPSHLSLNLNSTFTPAHPSQTALIACQWSKVIKLLSKVYLTVNG